MRPIARDGVAYGPSVSLSATIVRSAKTADGAEPTEMPFGLWTRVGPRNHVLDERPRPHMKRQFRGGKGSDPSPKNCTFTWGDMDPM